MNSVDNIKDIILHYVDNITVNMLHYVDDITVIMLHSVVIYNSYYVSHCW